MTETAALVINLDLKLAYDPAEGRLYRTDAEGRVRHELSLWREDEKDGFAVGNIWLPGIGTRRANRVIFYLMAGRWPAAGMMIDHVNRDVTDSRWANLREATPSQNARNADYRIRRCNGSDEVLEAGVIKRSSGNYSVTVTGV
jgi:hypothetical protein